jgi:hypothetical protein
MVAADVPDALVAVLEHSDAEEDADDERDHQHHEQEAPHVLLSPGELAHACVFPSCLSGVWAIVRAVQVLQGRALLLLIGGRLPATAQVCRPLFDGMAMASNISFVPCPASDRIGLFGLTLEPLTHTCGSPSLRTTVGMIAV